MLNVISEEEAKREINKAEKILSKSFDRLLALKRADKNFKDYILTFQPELAECLYGLMTFYRKLKTEARDIISKKRLYSLEEFSKLMAQNKKFADTVKKAIEMGKRLGDAFVWFFYQGNLSELEKHFNHESTGLFVAGIGGRGEIEFIKNTPVLNGCLVLYHGITSMLRIGDFSLYGFDMGIVGIGELKSEQVGQNIEVRAYITSKIKLDFELQSDALSKTQLAEKPALNPVVAARLKKQLPIHKKALHTRKADMEISKIAHFEYNLIDELEQNDVVLNNDKSLLLLATRAKTSGLFEMLNENDDGVLPECLHSMAEQMILPNSAYNRFIVGAITTNMSYSRKPILWWEIHDNVCKSIYFGRLRISTVFNPAQMIQHYVDKGYSVVNSTNMRQIKLRKIVDDYKTEFGNFEMLFDLISHSLLKTEYVIELSDKVIADTENGKFPPNAKIDMITHLPCI